MQKLLLKNISQMLGIYDEAPKKLAGPAMNLLPAVDNAWLACENGLVSAWGRMDDFEGIGDWKGLQVIDCTGKVVMPGFVDSHTHIVFAGNRELEFIDRINGLSYELIAKRGGGILNSAKKLRETSESDLYDQSLRRLKEVIKQGTVGIEIKSGYGLDLESELKMLRVIRRLKELALIPVRSTFLGAHAVPLEFNGDRPGYVKYILEEMLPAVAGEKLADYIDVFCEQDYFTESETMAILEAGEKHGLQGKVHAEQLSHSNGIKAGVMSGAVSVDHLEYCNDEDIALLRTSKTIPTILPGAAFFLGLPFPPARKMIDNGLPVAIASDYNPGSSPSGNMKLMISLACIQYRLTPEEAINAATINGAFAAGLNEELGCIAPGKRASFLITSATSHASIPYAYGTDLIETVITDGKVFPSG